MRRKRRRFGRGGEGNLGTGGKERPRASAEVPGSARASSGGADFGTPIELTGPPRCAGRRHEFPAGDAASGGLEKWKAEALRTTLARVSGKLGAEVFLRHLSPGIEIVPFLG